MRLREQEDRSHEQSISSIRDQGNEPEWGDGVGWGRWSTGGGMGDTAVVMVMHATMVIGARGSFTVQAINARLGSNNSTIDLAS